MQRWERWPGQPVGPTSRPTVPDHSLDVTRQGLEVDCEPDPLSASTRRRPRPWRRFNSEFVPSIPARNPYRLRHCPSNGPPPTSDVHPGEVRTQHVGSTRRPLSPELTTPPHRTPWAQRAGFTHLPSEVHSLGSIFILVLGHGLMSRGTHRRTPCRNVDVKVCSRQPGPITPVGLRWRPASDRALVPLRASHPTIRRVAPQLRRTERLSPPPSHRRRHRLMASPRG